MDKNDDELLNSLSLEVTRARDQAVRLISQRNRRSMILGALRKKSPPAAPSDILEAELALAGAEAETDRAKEVCRRAEAMFVQELTESKIRKIAPRNQGEARAILDEKRAALNELAPAVSSGDIGGAAGIVFGIEIRINQARERGDNEYADQMLPKLEVAKARLEALERLNEPFKQRLKEVSEGYEAKLSQLRDEE
jgi:hypothetical protein